MRGVPYRGGLKLEFSAKFSGNPELGNRNYGHVRAGKFSASPVTSRMCREIEKAPQSTVHSILETLAQRLNMSDSSLSSVAPSNAMLEQALRNAVQGLFKAGNFEELTIKRVRVAAERYLDLEDGFFKNDPTWKEESKRIIQAEVVGHQCQLGFQMVAKVCLP